MKAYDFFLTHSLEKVFPAVCPERMEEGQVITVLQGELPVVQLVYYGVPGENAMKVPFAIDVQGAPVAPRLRTVELVPSDFPAYERKDDNYITTQPGMFPDLLRPMQDNQVYPLAGQYRAVWIDFPGLERAAAGEYVITVKASALAKWDGINGKPGQNPSAAGQVKECKFILRVLACRLPEQALLHTQWFHGDGIANYYNIEVFSERYWTLLDRYIAIAGEELGINTLLTPVFTPPLDTAVGWERRCVQLVDISRQGDAYTFNFDKLIRWCGMCRAHGITHLEMPHLFTQWGAECTPNIYAETDGVQKRIFGWDVSAQDPSYRAFLEALIPALQKVLAENGYAGDHVIYHISDEPTMQNIHTYQAARNQVADLLEGCFILDALSDYAFYEQGLVEHPVPANDHIAAFIENKVPDLWVYYCCSQCVDVPNRFFSMPSARNRIMGVLMYLFDIKGFLHWGYNFYNSQFSLRPINPYIDTHAHYAFPSGDAYLVYPGENDEPWSSIRAQVQRQALDDLNALRKLEELAGRERVEKLIREDFDGEMSFSNYPKDPAYLFRLREKIGAEIAKTC